MKKIEQTIDEAIKKLKEIRDEIRGDRCPIPMANMGNRIGIPFNGNRSALYYDGYTEFYGVAPVEEPFVYCRLIRVEAKDLRPGDVFISAGENISDADYGQGIHNYSICLNSEELVYVADDKECIVDGMPDWPVYKLVK